MLGLLLALVYVCFISLGLPDSLLGSAWPILHQEINVPVSFAGIISTVISLGTIVSSLLSDRLVKKWGSGTITAVSIAMTAAALFGFSVSGEFWLLLLWAIPYGLGAGGVDAVLNNYVALHFKPQHMSWLHCFWGVGASISPYIMSFALVKLQSWNDGYLIVSIIQIVLSLVIFLSLPLWKKGVEQEEEKSEPLRFGEILRIPGAVPCFILFFAYCSLELSASLWASSFLADARGVAPEIASAFASLFYIGMTVGRGINGFFAMKFEDRTLIRTGLAIITVGAALLFLPFAWTSLVGFVVVGLGCAPVYPCIIHMTPSLFGKERSQAMIGVQMAAAYSGFCVVPPLVGLLAEKISILLLPVCLAALLILIIAMHETVVRKTKKEL